MTSTGGTTDTANAQRARSEADAALEVARLPDHAAFVRANVDLDRALAEEAERVRAEAAGRAERHEAGGS